MAKLPFPAQRKAPGTGNEGSRQLVTFGIVNERGDLIPPDVLPLLVLNINPENFDEGYVQMKTEQSTRGGWLEQHWGEELGTITCSGSTGLFIGTFPMDKGGLLARQRGEAPGITTVHRRYTIAHARMNDFIDLYRNNGQLVDARGRVAAMGAVRIIYDGGIYDGFFENFTPEEEAEQPFVIKLDWTFKVEKTVMRLFGVPSQQRQRIDAPRIMTAEVPTEIPAAFGEANMTDEEMARRHALMANPASFEQDDAEELAAITARTIQALRGDS